MKCDPTWLVMSLITPKFRAQLAEETITFEGLTRVGSEILKLIEKTLRF